MGCQMKRSARSKDLARQRALIRSLIAQNPFGLEAAERPAFAATAAGVRPEVAAGSAKIIPFPDLRREA